MNILPFIICIICLLQDAEIPSLYGAWYLDHGNNNTLGWKVYKKAATPESIPPFTDYFQINKEGSLLWQYPGPTDSFISYEGMWLKKKNKKIVFHFPQQTIEDIIVDIKNINEGIIRVKLE